MDWEHMILFPLNLYYKRIFHFLYNPYSIHNIFFHSYLPSSYSLYKQLSTFYINLYNYPLLFSSANNIMVNIICKSQFLKINNSFSFPYFPFLFSSVSLSFFLSFLFALPSLHAVHFFLIPFYRAYSLSLSRTGRRLSVVGTAWRRAVCDRLQSIATCSSSTYSGSLYKTCRRVHPRRTGLQRFFRPRNAIRGVFG
jgi:hypothetical protein